MADAVVSYKPGQDLTGLATAAVTGGRLVKVSAARAAGENVKVAHAGAGEPVFGVAGHDAASGAVLHVLRGGVVDLTAANAITAGQRVIVAADGKVNPYAATAVSVTVTGEAQTVAGTVTEGHAIGVALDDIAQNAAGPVALDI